VVALGGNAKEKGLPDLNWEDIKKRRGSEGETC